MSPCGGRENRLPPSSVENRSARRQGPAKAKMSRAMGHDAHHLDEVQTVKVVPDVEGGGQQVIHRPKDDTGEVGQPPRACHCGRPRPLCWSVSENSDTVDSVATLRPHNSTS